MDLIRPDWPAPPGVHALCTTRDGGVSGEAQGGGRAGLNLGTHVGDDPATVAENRARLARAAGARPVYLQQVHGSTCARLDAASADGLEADACITADPGLACTIMVADCLPVLLCDAEGRQVAAAHCGWRGLAGGVLERTVAAFGPARTLLAWLGPCIGPTAFEVGPEVRAAFIAADEGAAACFVPGAAAGKWLADLPALARRRLAALGVRDVHGNDGGAAWCTVGNPSVFFSYRRDGRVSGRFAALVWRD
ncbi:peptidoglycan editing factor PgeF [uncultured Pseudacidovorax sp.]|uniref:peptidoglycan editing factor PgeF n=1 Tax=uncultured Pseudacidovorax sp. TaxID=679313 RepID=UPI0025CF98EE|nr:peptidoglycan editing factor PgeF [uncultured Pseudacidovorax sp.]